MPHLKHEMIAGQGRHTVECEALLFERDDRMRTILAIYENGVFRPQEPIDLPSGSRVVISLPDDRDPVEVMRERFPLSFGALSDEDAEKMKRAIEEECERIDPDAWR